MTPSRRNDGGSIPPQDIRLIQESFERVAEAFASRSVVVDSSIGEMKAKLAAMDVMLRGNGKEGLTTSVSKMDARIESMEKEITAIQSETKRFLWWLIGLLVSMLGVMITTFVFARLTK